MTLDPEPGDAEECEVDDQDVTDDVEPESTITLTVSCEVPDVTGKDAESAQSDLELGGYRGISSKSPMIRAPALSRIKTPSPATKPTPVRK